MLLGRISSIRNKLLLVVVTTTIAALIVACIATEAYDLHAYHKASISELFTEADIIGRASAAALIFDDPKAASGDLSLLKATPRMLAAAIYTPQGTLFASYIQNKTINPRFPNFPEVDGWHISDNKLVVFRRVIQNGEMLGTVYLQARYEVLERFKDYVGILAVVMLASLLVSVLLSHRLNAAVTEPILEISRVARRVMESRDFGLRARKTTNDEIGSLADRFNDMLAEIGRAENALRIADRHKDEFLATLAHELRNPLAPIRHATRIIGSLNATEEQLRWARQIMERQVAHMARLLDDLLDVSRITRGKLELRKELLDVKMNLMSVVETVRPLIEARGHKLTIELSPGSLYVEADAVRFAQIFSNLLTNAAKYTDADGIIRVRVNAERRGIAITVQDNGIGISTDQLPHLFEMFSQASSALERAEGGLGIGLSLVRGLVLLHGGSIEARSPGLGKGSEFTVTMPYARSNSKQKEVFSDSGSKASNERKCLLRILVVDDNTDNADSCSMLLRMSGHEVRTAYFGKEALKIAEEFSPQMVLLDIGMPDMNGYDVANRIRELREGMSIVLVAVTGWGQREDKRKAQLAGFNHHLTKPIDFEILQTLIDQQCSQSRADGESL